MTHLRPAFFLTVGGQSTTRMASSKTDLRPFCVSAEHSRYLTAPIVFDWSRPSSKVMGVEGGLFSRSFATVFGSLRRSSFVPTRIIGTPGAWCFSSGNHLAFTFSNEGRLISEKATRNTSVCG